MKATYDLVELNDQISTAYNQIVTEQEDQKYKKTIEYLQLIKSLFTKGYIGPLVFCFNIALLMSIGADKDQRLAEIIELAGINELENPHLTIHELVNTEDIVKILNNISAIQI